MDVSRFNFDLPEDLIALRPAVPRDSARMLVVHADGRLEHAAFRDLPKYLCTADVMVTNDTKVIAARLRGTRCPRRPEGPQAKVEVLLCRRLGSDRYSVLARPARKLDPGDTLRLGRDLTAEVLARSEGGEAEILFPLGGSALDAAIAAQGETPLPPYIAGRRRADDRDRNDYQTVYARQDGSVAAPTAGLHFTPSLLKDLAAKGVARESVTLHVGLGTFQPVTAADTEQHRMHAEWATVGADVAERLNAARANGGRIAAVGTTSLRTLESAADPGGRLHPFAADTSIFITPGYRFRTAEILVTNFHLPKSTLFMLVSAFSGLDTMKRAYQEAIRAGYRFYSYGDACLLFRQPT